MRSRHTTEDALTGLGIIKLILVIILRVYSTLVLFSSGRQGGALACFPAMRSLRWRNG